METDVFINSEREPLDSSELETLGNTSLVLLSISSTVENEKIQITEC